MFYSQFILAKKGPLGTIWIAAHLERKLRKNQVADTDIGVSVDSILFPEVPIALRLSSHLLLGVVRIYSRKVNYLFDDCSEALLKIKQAFRSTAVDLPPEESTAPYHSITLPETFDLDDFELPDNDIFQGNYVDHHVSTREQITLQDSMDGVNYSTSQFGLDERFGDGDISQIGLDLDEELLLDKVTAGKSDEVSNADPQGSGKPMIPQHDDAVQQTDHDNAVDQMNETSEVATVNGTASQAERLDADAEMIDYAEAPCTPGLVEEPNLSSVQEALASDDRMEVDIHESDKSLDTKTVDSDAMKSDNNAMDSVHRLPPKENGYHSNMEFKPGNPLGDSAETMPIVSDCSEGIISVQDSLTRKDGGETVFDHKTIPDVPSVETMGVRSDQAAASPSSLITSDILGPHKTCPGSTDVPVSEGRLTEDHISVKTKVHEDVETADIATEGGSPCMIEAVDGQTSLGLKDSETLGSPGVQKEMSSDYMNVLKPCNYSLNRPEFSSPGYENSVAVNLESEEADPCKLETSRREGASTEMQGDDHVRDVVQSEENPTSQTYLCGATDANNMTLDEQINNALSSQNQLENLNNSTCSDLPPPEKLLSVQEGILDKTNDLLVEITPDREVLPGSCEADAANQPTTAKKRSYTESTLTMESLNSSESFGVTKSKRNTDSVPDDDDLLSSILVGRRTSVLKMKPTPPVQQVASRKRARSAAQINALKRKVLLDDAMVLHGDIIRQQLTDTEDIRRVRKKAPCTCAEILMIQIQFLEEEIFSEPLLTGMSKELLSLQQETHDLSRIRISDADENNDFSEVANNVKTSVRPNETEADRTDDYTEPVVVTLDVEVDAQPAETTSQNMNQQGGEDPLGSHDIDTLENSNASVEDIERKVKQREESTMIRDSDVDRIPNEVTDLANLVTHETEMCSTEGFGMPAKVKSGSPHASFQMDALSSSPGQKGVTEPVEEKDYSLHGEAVEFTGEQDQNVGIENGAKTGAEVLLEGKVDASVGSGADVQTDILPPTENANAFEAASLEAGGSSDFTLANGEHLNIGTENVDVVVVARGSHDREDRASAFSCAEEAIMDSVNTVEHHTDSKAAPTENVLKESDLQSRIEADVNAFDQPAAEDRSELEDITFGNDTEFLNVDDDDVAEDYDDGMGSAEETRLLENTGWSARTRAVAKYLQNLFDKETVQGRKVLELDHLLAGKTRKEASRMFFETLVLKTKDFIQVEQPKPLDNINVKPRAKLMKSNF